MYCGKLAEKIGTENFICYADDGYVVVVEDNLEQAKEKVKALSLAHVNELERLGMQVNCGKTEAVVFKKKGEPVLEDLNIAGCMIKSKRAMKVLGVIFDYRLSWEEHVTNVVKRCQNKIGVLKRIRRNFTEEQALKIITAQLFSILYYCAPVWLHTGLRYDLRRLVESMHFKVLRIAIKDHKNQLSKHVVTKRCRRACPDQWGQYLSASTLIKIMRDKTPVKLYNLLEKEMYTERRKPNKGKFRYNAEGKIGKQKFNNRLDHLLRIKDDWLEVGLSNNAIRKILKKTFFDYFD